MVKFTIRAVLLPTIVVLNLLVFRLSYFRGIHKTLHAKPACLK